MIRIFPLSKDERVIVCYVLNIVETLTATQGNIRAAAGALGMSEHTLRHQMKELQMVDWNRKAHPLSVRQPRNKSNEG